MDVGDGSAPRPRGVRRRKRQLCILLDEAPVHELGFGGWAGAARAQQLFRLRHRHGIDRTVTVSRAFELSLQDWRAPSLCRAATLASTAAPLHAGRWERARMLVAAVDWLATATRLELFAHGAPHVRDTRLHVGIWQGPVREDQSHVCHRRLYYLRGGCLNTERAAQ
jgi:hypothetical protein